jgi:hypothetical protein
VDGEIQFETKIRSAETLVDIVAVVTESMASDVTGKIASGYLKLRGPLRSGFLTNHPFDHTMKDTTGVERRVAVYLDDPSNKLLDQRMHYLPVSKEPNSAITALLLEMTGQEGKFRRKGLVTFGTFDGIVNMTPLTDQCPEYACYDSTTSVYDVTII